MAIRYKIFEDLKFVYAVGTGALTLDDLLSHTEELANDPKYVAPMLKLIDYRNLQENKTTFADSERFAAAKSSFADRFSGEKFAVVVPTDNSFGMARHNSAHLKPGCFEHGVFREIKEALDWLGLEIDENELAIDESDPGSPS